MNTIIYADTPNRQDCPLISNEQQNFRLILFNYLAEDEAGLRDRWTSAGHRVDDVIMYRSECKGGLMRRVAEHPISDGYFGIWDHDIEASTGDLNSLFTYAKAHDLDWFQPSLSLDSPASHRFCHRAGDSHRPVPFVEIMVPMFSTRFWNHCKKALRKTASKSGWGFDTVLIPGSIQYFYRRVIPTVIDAYTVRHSRPVRSSTYVFANGTTPRQEHRQMKQKGKQLLEQTYLAIPSAAGPKHTI